MTRSAQVLKEKGLRVTPQRLGVYKLLREDSGHFTAEKIYFKVKKSFPAISLATVYSILELLKENNLVQEIRINFDKSSFELKACPHHHFLCNSCGKIFDIDIMPCTTLKDKKINGHTINKFQGYFYGICKDCEYDESSKR
jgi:Fur family peroxide stress response transcriptional regulator